MANQKTIALYSDVGVDEEGIPLLAEILEGNKNSIVVKINRDELLDSELKRVDLLIIPGGRASQICQHLGTKSKEIIVDFIRNGGAFLGICAGMYAASSKYDWSFKLIPMQVLDTKHWQRGEKLIRIKFTDHGKEIFNAVEENELDVFFANGPMIAPFPEYSNLNYITLATYCEEIVHSEGIPGLMLNNSAVVLFELEKGNIVCIGPHFEYTENKGYLLRNLIENMLNL